MVSEVISPGAPSPSKPTFLRRYLAQHTSENLLLSQVQNSIGRSFQVKSKMTTASDRQKDTKAAGDVDATVDTSMDVAADNTASDVFNISEASSASGVEQSPLRLNVSERDEEQSPGDCDAVVSEEIKGGGAARTTAQVVVSLIDSFFPRHI